MKIENVRDVKMQLNRIIKDLPKTGSVVITTNGRHLRCCCRLARKLTLRCWHSVTMSDFGACSTQLLRVAKRKAGAAWRICQINLTTSPSSCSRASAFGLKP